jgi:probable HAF family extracellular repeat protein
VEPRPAILAVLSLAAAAPAQTAGLWQVGGPAWFPGSRVTCLSQSGTAAFGDNSGIGFRWTAAGGRMDFGPGPTYPYSSPVYAASSNGDVLVGVSAASQGGDPLAYRRVSDGPFESLGTLPAYRQSRALGVSGDGSVVVGAASDAANDHTQAFRWTAAAGMEPLGFLRPFDTRSVAYGISRNGSTIVGEAGATYPYQAFTWTPASGMQALPALAQGGFGTARAVNLDGSVIVGGGDSGPMTAPHAIRWEAGAAQDLGSLPHTEISIALAVSDDGALVGGTSYTTWGARTACLWTAGSGAVTLDSYLIAHGVAVPPTFITLEVDAISGNGLTFAGQGYNSLTGFPEGFVATIPSPAAAVLLLAPVMTRRRRHALAPAPRH